MMLEDLQLELVTLSYCLNFSETQFAHLKNQENNNNDAVDGIHLDQNFSPLALLTWGWTLCCGGLSGVIRDV